MRILFLIPLSLLLLSFLSPGSSKPVPMQDDFGEYITTRLRGCFDDNVDIEAVKAQLYLQVDAILDNLVECIASGIPLDECPTIEIRQKDSDYHDEDGNNTAMTMQSRYPDPGSFGGYDDADYDSAYYDNDLNNAERKRYPDRSDDGESEDFYNSSGGSENDVDHDSECDGSNCPYSSRNGSSYSNNFGNLESGKLAEEDNGCLDNKGDNEDCEDFRDSGDDNEHKTGDGFGSYPKAESSRGVGESGFNPEDGGSGSGSENDASGGTIPVEVTDLKGVDCLCIDHKCSCKDSD
nr:hypothetical protein HmN_000763800 [Hymenolepis microstoma]